MKVTLLFLVAVALAEDSPRLIGFNGFPEMNVRGVEVIKGEFPWMVSLQMRGVHMCGGTILTSSLIITAAHCVLNAADYYTVVAGDHDLLVNDGTEQHKGVLEIIRHSNYNPSDITNDIAVMRLNSSLTFNEYVQPANMPGANFIPGDNVVTIGWGVRPDGGYISNTLRKLTVPYFTNTDCKLAYGNHMLEGMICAGVDEDNNCAGGGGGPLHSGNIVIGIGSWGFGCGSGHYPMVYSSVVHFTSWISGVIN